MSEINVSIIKNENADYGPNLVGYSTVTGDLNVTGSIRAGAGLTVTGITTFSSTVFIGSGGSSGAATTDYSEVTTSNLSPSSFNTTYLRQSSGFTLDTGTVSSGNALFHADSNYYYYVAQSQNSRMLIWSVADNSWMTVFDLSGTDFTEGNVSNNQALGSSGIFSATVTANSITADGRSVPQASSDIVYATSSGGAGAGVTITSDGNISVGNSITLYGATGVITASKYYGDGSNLENLPSSAGLGTALSDDTTSPLNKIYYTDQVLAIGSTITVDAPDSAQVAYTQYAQVVLNDDADLIVAAGDDFIPDILGIGTTGVGAGTLAGDGGRVRADNLTNRAGTGAPTTPNGLIVTGVVTATSGNFTGNVTIGGTLTYEDVTNIDSVGMITARKGIQILADGLDVVSGVATVPNLVVENSAYTAITTTSTSKTIVNREYCTVVTSSASTALNITITLPASPQPGWEVGVAVGGTFLDTVVGRNGSNIMGLSEDMTLNREYIPVQLVYVDAEVGWRFF